MHACEFPLCQLIVLFSVVCRRVHCPNGSNPAFGWQFYYVTLDATYWYVSNPAI